MKYVLMFIENEEYAAALAAMDQAEAQAAYAKVGQWFADHADLIIHHAHLAPAETASTLRLGAGDPVVTDGPFVEGKEVVSGFVEIDVPDLDEALRVARSWPACPIVEIRPVA
ncbi:YciI family protein [Nonomuraea sp. AD125B]|uniref:YciI family protein n=1 Tax=Nonomuraea sp. AD125B TaxID=3242897 RepID=UPI003527500B